MVATELSLDEISAYCEKMLAGKTSGRALVKLKPESVSPMRI
jgi:hypothetical protein